MDELNKNMKVLVVDDFPAMRKKIIEFLGQLGINRIDEANDGAIALSMLRESKYDVVLADWYMPKMSGYDLLKTMKTDENLKDIPFLIITTKDAKNNIIAAAKAGVSDYVIKPFTADVLEQKLKRTLLGVKASKQYNLPNTAVSEIMQTEVVTVHQTTTLKVAMQILCNQKIPGMPVVDESGHIIGVVTEQDLLHSAVTGDLDKLIEYTKTPDHISADTTLKNW